MICELAAFAPNFISPLCPYVKCIFLHLICFDKDNEYVSMARNSFLNELKPLFYIQESIEFCGVEKQVLNVGIKNDWCLKEILIYKVWILNSYLVLSIQVSNRKKKLPGDLEFVLKIVRIALKPYNL